jgi:hypothetical protein
MGQTKYYGMAFFDFGDDLDSSLSVQKEIDRFVLIDKQIYGLYNIFGNGVINGWDVTDAGYNASTGISINISMGIGIINYISAETSIPYKMTNLFPNSIIDIYVMSQGSTVRDRKVIFRSVLSTGSNSASGGIKIATVVTGDNTVNLIDSTVKDIIGFEQIIQDEINQHRHTGTPSKIDLQDEVKNQLPGARIESLDASKITSGLFDIDRIPLIDHNELENNGLLSHAALDSFARTLSQNNRELLGEIASVNLLKTVIFLNYLYPDIDDYFVNEIALIPGISPNSHIDFVSTTANVSLTDRCIGGIPATTGLFQSVYWNNQYSLFNAYYKNNVVVSNAEVSLEKTSTIVETIEDFNDVLNDGTSIPGFVKEMVSTSEQINVVSEATDSNKVEGSFSGAFSASTENRVVYSKDIKINGVARDWTGKYDELVIWVKTSVISHDPVYFNLVNKEGTDDETILGPWTLLDRDEITQNDESNLNNFKEIIIPIFGLEVDSVSKMVIYTDDVSDDFEFFLDDIHVRRRNLYVESGVIRFRYSALSDVVFYNTFFEHIIPQSNGENLGNISVRVKTAESIDLLLRSSYKTVSSGGIFAKNGTAIEIEVTISTNDQTVTPIFNYLELRMLVDSDFAGFSLNSRTDWSRGDLYNVSISDTSIDEQADLSISTPINVGGYYFGYNNAVSEMRDTNSALSGFGGTLLLPSPNQAMNWNNNAYRQFSFPTSVSRQLGRTYIVADTRNNRVLQLGDRGELIKGFGSTYVTDDTFYPVSAVYNNVSTVLSVCFTKQAVVSDITKIYITSSGVKFYLTGDEIVLNNQKSLNKVLEIKLGSNLSTRLIGAESDVFVDFDNGAFEETVSLNTRLGNLVSPLYGFECFIGDFTYIDSIQHPVYANILSNGNWIVSNSSIFYTAGLEEDEFDHDADSSIVSLFEFDPASPLSSVYSFENITFSDFALGSVYEIDENRFLVAGLQDGGAITSSVNILEGVAQDDVTEKMIFRQDAISSLSSYRGTILILDKQNNKFRTFYTSPDGIYPSDISRASNGDYIVAESSFLERSGRVIRLDSFGNIIWNYFNGTLDIVNDAKILQNDNIMISI